MARRGQWTPDPALEKFISAAANGPTRPLPQVLDLVVDGRKYELSSMERSLDPDGEITFRFTPVKET